MKRNILMAALMTTLVACRKDRVCTCTESHTDTDYTNTFSYSGTSVTKLSKVKKSDALAACPATYTDTYADPTISYTNSKSCTLK